MRKAGVAGEILSDVVVDGLAGGRAFRVLSGGKRRTLRSSPRPRLPARARPDASAEVVDVFSAGDEARASSSRRTFSLDGRSQAAIWPGCASCGCNRGRWSFRCSTAPPSVRPLSLGFRGPEPRRHARSRAVRVESSRVRIRSADRLEADCGTPPPRLATARCISCPCVEALPAVPKRLCAPPSGRDPGCACAEPSLTLGRSRAARAEPARSGRGDYPVRVGRSFLRVCFAPTAVGPRNPSLQPGQLPDFAAGQLAGRTAGR